MTKEVIRETLEKIRYEHPDKPMGDHWEGVGVYLGMWAAPEFVGMPGELEILGV